MRKRRIMLRGRVIHGIVVATWRVRASRAVQITPTVDGTLLVAVGGILLVAVVMICVIHVSRWTTILLNAVIWATKHLIWQSDVLDTGRIVWRLRIWRESLTFIRREGVRGAMLRRVCPSWRREHARCILLLLLLLLLRHYQKDPRRSSQLSRPPSRRPGGGKATLASFALRSGPVYTYFLHICILIESQKDVVGARFSCDLKRCSKGCCEKGLIGRCDRLRRNRVTMRLRNFCRRHVLSLGTSDISSLLL